MCVINLTENRPTCSCNLLQLQKLPCVHVITACALDCANISTYILCAQWYTEDNYNKIYAGPFHPVLDKRYWPGRSGPTMLPLEVRRPPGCAPYVCIRGHMDEGCEGHRCNICSNCK